MADNQATTHPAAVTTDNLLTQIDAVTMLIRAKNYLHGEPEKLVYTLHRKETSPQVRAHWSACNLLERKANQVCRGLKREWDKQNVKDKRERELAARTRDANLREALDVLANYLGVKISIEASK